MSATAENIWRVPAYLPYLQPPLTDAAIAATEDEIGQKLPAIFLNLLKEQNGGYIRYGLPKRPHKAIVGIGPHFPSLTDFDWDECQEDVGFPLQGLVPFDGDGHWHLCLDYRKSREEPAVTYVDIERGKEVGVAGSFTQYLAKLKLDIRDEWILEGGSGIEAVVVALAEALGVAFEPPDSSANGYPTYRVQLGTEEAPQWIWISANTVPRGFVRPEDPRYAELRESMPGQAARFPEAPPESCIFSTTPAVRARVNEACSRVGMRVRPLRDYVNRP